MKKVLFYCQFWPVIALMSLYILAGSCLFECGQQALQEDLKFVDSETNQVKISENNN